MEVFDPGAGRSGWANLAGATGSRTGQVGADGVRAGVQPLAGQLLAEPDDLILELDGDRPRAGVRTPRPRLERGLTLGLVPGDELADPESGDVVVAGHLALGASLDDDSGDDQSGLGHGLHLQQKVSTMSRDSCQLCPETRHLRARHT
jgi:hypothetical protein